MVYCIITINKNNKEILSPHSRKTIREDQSECSQHYKLIWNLSIINLKSRILEKLVNSVTAY